MDAKKNQPVFGEGFWLICIAVGVLLLGIVCFFSRREDLHSCERRMSVTVEFIKEQVGSYSKYNKIAMAKALVRETTAVPRLAGISMDCDEGTLHRLAEDVWVTGISVLDAQCELLCEYTTDGVGYEELRAGIAPERLANVLAYPQQQVPTDHILSLLQSAGPIAELTLHERSMDRMIADMYQEMAL